MRVAFTLLELLVAMAIGLMLVAIAFVGFRAAAQTINAADRLSMKNGLIRAGVLAAFDEIDTWRGWDNPEGDPADTDPTWSGRRLRQVYASAAADTPVLTGKYRFSLPATKVGTLFTPLSQLRDLREVAGPSTLFDPAAPAGATREGERGHQANVRWDASDERTWYRGYHRDGMEVWENDGASSKGGAGLKWGRFGLLTSTWASPVGVDGSETRRAFTIDGESMTTHGYMASFIAGEKRMGDSGDTGWANVRAFGNMAPSHSWRDSYVIGILHGLGHYGALEYLPANAVFGAYGMAVPDSNIEEEGVVRSWRWIARPHHGFQFAKDWVQNAKGWEGGSPTGIQRHSAATRSIGLASGDKFEARSVPAITCSPYGTWNFHEWDYNDGSHADWETIWATRSRVDHLMQETRSCYGSGSNEYVQYNDYRRTMENSTITRPVNLRQPGDWPEVSYAVSRYYSLGRIITTATVRWNDARNGINQELVFSSYGTTLRGARQQRGRAGGWARWNGPRLGIDRDANLDDY